MSTRPVWPVAEPRPLRGLQARGRLCRRLLFGLACGFGLTACATRATDATRPAQPVAVTVPAGSARFVPVHPRLPDGPRMAVLWGDPARGASAMLLEMRRGAVPLHLHSADYHLVVLEGTMKHWPAGGSEALAAPLGPGSYWFQPGGQVHADACLSERCLAHIVWSGARDARLAPSDAQRPAPATPSH